MESLTDARVRFQRFVLDVRRVRREKGLSHAVQVMVRLVYRQLYRPVALAREYRFDRRTGLTTRGWQVISAEAMARARHPDGTDFEPTPVRELSRILDSLPPIDRSEFTFIDLGCGKGGTLAVAALRGFRRVIGVELDTQLVAVARANAEVVAERSRGRIEIVEEDASTYRFPPEPTVLYLFNPFGEGTMRSVAESLAASHRERPRPLLVVYVHPLYREVWDRLSAWQLLREGRRWVLYGTTDVASGVVDPSAARTRQRGRRRALVGLKPR